MAGEVNHGTDQPQDTAEHATGGGRRTALAFLGMLALVAAVVGIGSVLAERWREPLDVRPVTLDVTPVGLASTSVPAAQEAMVTVAPSPTRTGPPTAEPTVTLAQAIAGATVALTVTPTPTAIPTSAATATPAPAILYSTDFTNWFQGEESGPYPARTSRDPQTGEYRVALIGPQRGYVNYRLGSDEQQFADFQLDVDARKVAGPDNGIYGVVFRVQPAVPGAKSYEYYSFVITADGYYTLSLVNTEGRGTAVAPRGTHPAIVKGNGVNHLTVVCRETQITLAVNGQLLGTFTGSLTAAGMFGPYVGELSTTSTAPLMDVAFSNLLVISSVP